MRQWFESRDCRVAEQPHFGNTLQCFTPITIIEVRTVILKCPNKLCDLDPFPKFLLKRCIDQLIHPTTAIITMSMFYGVIPDDFKHALVNPLITNNILSKINLRTVILFLIWVYVEGIGNDYCKSSPWPHIYDLQSALKRFHSNETALLKIHYKLDNWKCTALTLLDLSAVFDTFDHDIPLQCLHRNFGISGTALLWLSSYLSNRYQRINISGSRSCTKYIPFGVPHGSVLGPVLFSLYSTLLSRVITTRNINITYMPMTQTFI